MRAWCHRRCSSSVCRSHLLSFPCIAVLAACGPAVSPPGLVLAPPAPPIVRSLPLGPTDLPPAPAAAALVRRAILLACTSYTQAMKVLVISADGKEADLQAIETALGYHGVPYAIWIAAQNPGLLTVDKLANGCAGNYQGVILTTGNLAYSPDGGATWRSGLSATEWQTLRSYESTFHVREISWYVYPGADQGLNPPSAGIDTSAFPLTATLTSAGRTAFAYVNAANPLTISMAWTYLATPSDSSVTPLLVDGAGNALVSTRTTADGRETMALTFDSNPYLIHELVLAHGLIEWVTKGIYLGEFRSYLTPQVDYFFSTDDIYGGGNYRVTSTDLSAAHTWQTTQQTLSGNLGLHLALAFNGAGSSALDTLTTTAATFNGDFAFINNTFDHAYLDNTDYAAAFGEIDNNNQFAKTQGYQNFSATNLITPDVSGLSNANVLAAARNAGVKYMVSDSSKPGWSNPTPNIGIRSSIEPSILFLPRRPTNLFYNVSTPAEWTAEYNAIYSSYWGRSLAYSEILDKESQNILAYMLEGEIDPQMFHQPNLRAYDGVHTVLTDLLDLTIQKFRKYSTLPIVSPNMEVAGLRVANTMARNESGLTATLTPGVSVSFYSPVKVQFAISGVCTLGSESYAGKCITVLDVAAGQTLSLATQ